MMDGTVSLSARGINFTELFTVGLSQLYASCERSGARTPPNHGDKVSMGVSFKNVVHISSRMLYINFVPPKPDENIVSL